jgi:hypothetical protein
MRGSRCPNCGSLTFFDKGAYQGCRCGYIGWSWRQGVNGVGKGKGNICPNCARQTLHSIVTLPHGEKIRRCATCDYSAVEPATTIAGMGAP